MSDDEDQLEHTLQANLKDVDFSLNQYGETVNYLSVDEPTDDDEPTADDKEQQEQAPQPELKLPKSIGRYAIRGILGRGSFGAVYLGYDEKLERQVAIKVPLIEALQENADVADLFLEEARQLAQLTHTSIVTVFDVGVEDGLCYIVSDYLDGPDLNTWLRDRTPSWQESVRIITAVTDALAAAHAQSTVHRDVKPANIIMTQRTEGLVPVLVDFGLALSKSSSADHGSLRGLISGTPNYMSPEQARGEGHRIDGRTDVYALGVTLYRMLSGELPFQHKSVANLLQMVIEDEPRPPRQFVNGIPKELERICLKAMSKQITQRYTTAGDLAEDLRNLLSQHEAKVEAAQATVKPPEKPKLRDSADILIADDHQLSRFKLESDLKKWGHNVTVAEDGEQAWQLFQQGEFSIVITDWMMPNVDGLELVRRIRAAQRADYVYVIMLTAKSEMQDIVAGMSAGADDFLTKPFHRDELQVRLRAGTRITKLNRELNETNRRLKSSVNAASQIQQSVLPKSPPQVAGFAFEWDHRPCEELGGDMLNIVQLDDKHLALYVLDVTGEGVPAALLATNLSRVLSPATDRKSLLVEQRADNDTPPRVLKPAEVAQRLNQHFAETSEANQYFTLAYGLLNLESREFQYTSAGHPPVLHQPMDGSPSLLDVSSFPIGFAVEDAEFSQQSIILKPGDRLFMYSDGLPDAMNEFGEVFGAARLLEFVSENRSLPLDESVRSLMEELAKWRGETEGKDDVSILSLEAK